MIEFFQQDVIQLISLILIGLAVGIQLIYKKQLQADSENVHSADYKPSPIRKVLFVLLAIIMVLLSISLYVRFFAS